MHELDSKPSLGGSSSEFDHCVSEQLHSLQVSRETIERLEIYARLLREWQKNINLVSASSLPGLWQRHMLDSLQLIPLLPHGTRNIADLGSGAGFPGLVLAIATGCHLVLYESVAKKCAFLRAVIAETACHAVVHHGRIEAAEIPEACDVVTARALAPLPILLQFSYRFLRSGAVGLFHRGQNVDEELLIANKYWKIRYKKHDSITDSRSAILAIMEVEPC